MIESGMYCHVVVAGVTPDRARIELSGGFTSDEIRQAIVALNAIADEMEGR